MTDEDRLARLLCTAYPPTSAAAAPTHDLWRGVVDHGSGHEPWPWIDLGLAASAALALLQFPQCLTLLAYHL